MAIAPNSARCPSADGPSSHVSLACFIVQKSCASSVCTTRHRYLSYPAHSNLRPFITCKGSAARSFNVNLDGSRSL